MQIELNSQSIRRLISPTGADDQLVQAIYLVEYHKNLLRLNRLFERLKDESPTLIENTKFDQTFQSVKKIPKELQRRVLSYPSFSYWLEVAWKLVYQNAHILYPTMHIKLHLKEFQKFALAMIKSANLEKENFEFILYTDQKGRITLPGTGTYLQNPEYIAFQEVHIKRDENGLSIRANQQNITMIECSIPCLNNSVELNSVDCDLQLGGKYPLNFEDLTPDSTVKWLSSLEESWSWIKEISPELDSEFLLGITSLVPVCSDNFEVSISDTFSEAPGLIALSWSPDTSVMTEVLVHEYHHHKLYALLNLDLLIEDYTSEPILYSPWRRDPRPASGLLHGIYVFQAVLEFWRKFLKAGVPILQIERIRQRVYYLEKQLQTAINILELNSSFSQLGRALIDAIKSNVTQTYDFCFSKDEQQRLDELLKEHQDRWKCENADISNSSDINSKQNYSIKTADYLDKDTILKQALAWLNLDILSIDIQPLTYLRQPFDSLLEALVDAHHVRGLNDLKSILQGVELGDCLLLNLLCGHIAYLNKDYREAAYLYERCISIYPSAPYFWLCFMFCLRHMQEYKYCDLILTHLDLILARSENLIVQEEQLNPIDRRLSFIDKIISSIS